MDKSLLSLLHEILGNTATGYQAGAREIFILEALHLIAVTLSLKKAKSQIGIN